MQFHVKFTVGLAIVGSFITGMVVPTLISANSLLHLSAQSNQCLPQDATISAQHSVVLQASLDAIGYQATLGAIRAAQGNAAPGAVTPTSTPIANLPFADNFINNKRGWDLIPKDSGSASISQNTLILNLTKAPVFTESIPGLNTGEFYLESDVTVKQAPSVTSVGYYITDSTGQITALTLKQDRDAGFYLVYRYDGTHLTAISTIPSGKQLWTVGKSIRLGLNASGGLYELYLGGTVVASIQITGIITSVGFLNVEDWGSEPIATAFGKLVVQPALKQ